MGHKGEEVENWQKDWNLQLLNDPDDQDIFYSRRWRTTSTPYLGFATDDVAKCTTRTVQDQLAGSDHKPAMFTVELNTIILEENNRSSHIILKENNRVLTKKQAANHLAKQFSQVSDISVTNQRRQVGRQEIRERSGSHSNPQMRS